MFYSLQKNDDQKEYQEFLKIAGCLSNLFSDSKTPYLYYRVAEKIFCRAFNADDLSRSDVSADAKKDNLGIGLKTFLAGNNNTFQKVAEFNSDRPSYIDLPHKKLISQVAKLRNIRIEFTANAYDLHSSIYHCVLRENGKFKIFEENMNLIDIENIKIQKVNQNSIVFDDNIHEYSFLLSKSTLTKRFETSTASYEFNVDILKDPLLELRDLLLKKPLLFDKEKLIKQTIFLPLYGRKQFVYEKSGLNQWNAGGRDRNASEVYIPIPIFIHQNYPDFFPNRGTPFNLKLPSGENLQSKVCQANGKALMSYSNRELGKWILRKVLKLKDGELLTYEKLQEIGTDAVRVDKINDTHYEINFAKIGSYEAFKNKIYFH